MTEETADGRTEQGLEEAYRTLYAAPSAPQELIIELYWYLVRRLRTSEEGRDDRALDALNKAYGAILQGQRLVRDEWEEPPPSDDALGRTGRSPWALLQIGPDAPPDVVDVAYRFWRLRARGEAPEQLKKLDKAYRDLGGEGALPPHEPAQDDEEAGDLRGAGDDVPRPSIGATAVAAALACVRWLASATWSLTRWLAPRLRRAGHRGLVLLGVATWWCVRTAAVGIKRATPIVAQAIRDVARGSGSAVRTAVDNRASHARPVAGGRAPLPLKRPAHRQQAVDVKLDPSVEKRFAALASEDSPALLADWES